MFNLTVERESYFFNCKFGESIMELKIEKTAIPTNLNLNDLLEGISVGVNSPECTHGWSPKKETKK
jgi:hypothetical protein